MWRIRKDGGLAKADAIAVLDAPVATEPGAMKTYTLLGVARGTAPSVRATSTEVADLTVNAMPDLTRRLLIVILGTFALISILASAIPSPLEEPANALVTPNPAKAPWYFLWLQEIVGDTTIHLGSFTINGAFLGGVILPGLLIGLLTVWPWLDRTPAALAGRWFPRDRRVQNAVFIGLTIIILAFTFVGLYMRGPSWNFYWPWDAWPAIPGRI